ncbi:hypothetical protein BDP27DRAFT_887179 [Rhodocollybia butyracea]|uniref:Glucose receptor Git3 N-terminal domain-containing protein n=1 Tax=Rhodocollybia butyracea TaxID=206335 RepID=A0A9P5Q7D2_9AGAR|nr:hypothetical protein BDP27DRAFT_887179 [Rhodocollybia butyracea]
MTDQGNGFTFGTRLGLVFAVQSACCSVIMVSSLLGYIIYSTVAIKRNAARTWTVSTHIHYYFVNLLVFDLIQALGGIMDVKWVAEAGIIEGHLCTTQGLLMGDVGVAMSTAIIAIHTFCVLVLHRNPPARAAILILFTLWVFIALVIGISFGTHKGKDYYGNTQYWCWITSTYGFERIALEYFWLWLAAFINLVCYGIMAMVVKGLLVVEGLRIRFRFFGYKKPSSSKSINSPTGTGADRVEANAVAMHLLFYPLIYILAVFPITVVRWLAFTGSTVPFAATAFASITFSSSGVCNVILFAVTRPKLLPHREEQLTFNQLSSRSGSYSTGYSTRYSTRPGSYSAKHTSETFPLKQTLPSELPMAHIIQDRSSVHSI